jgi:hypothetical protein
MNNKKKNPKEISEHEIKRKTQKRKTKIKTGTIGYERCHTEEKKNVGKKCGEGALE